MRLVSFNYSQESRTLVSSSSESKNFPANNIKHEHRSKHWRSSGHFEITTNNTFNFVEGASTRTATIPVGNYSLEALRVAIKEKMDLVGSEDYSVSFSQVTGLWNISSNTPFQLLNSSLNFLNKYLGFLQTNETGTAITSANIAIHTSEYVVFDLKSTEEIDTIALLWSKEDGTRLSLNAQVTIQANATNTWTSPAYNQSLSVTDLYQISTKYLSSPQSYRFWRVVIKDPANPNLYVSLGVVVLGKYEQVTNPDNGFQYSLNDLSVVTSNRYGNSFLDKYPLQAELQLSFNNMDYEDSELFQRIYRSNGITTPVFVVVDPTQAKFNQDDFTIYGKFVSSYGLTHVVSDLFNSQISITEIN